jgi:lysophospholipase L1-like esterase
MLHRRLFLAAGFSLVSLNVFAADTAADKPLPTIVLVGDSIRMGYAPIVTEMLRDKAKVVAAKGNGGDSTRVISNLDEWVIAHRPDVVHFNCGLHDLKISRKTNTAQVPIDEYEKNLRTIVDRIQKETKARLIFATTTPIRDELHAKRKGDFDRKEENVKKYNEVALKVMKEKGVEIDDLHAVVTKAGVDKVQRTDGTHYTPEGSKTLAEAVVKSVTSDAPKK